LLARHVNIITMSKIRRGGEIFLKILSEEVGENDHVVLVMDQAGWHTSPKLKVPENITRLFLPPCSPELNPIPRMWAYLSNRAYEDYDALLDAGGEAHRSLTPELLKSMCATSWLMPEM